MFKFYLNSTPVSDPVNWNDFSETIERDPDIKGLLPKYEIKLTFSGGGYKLLYDLMKSVGFCNLVEIRVDRSCDGTIFTTILNGYIFISDCRFNLNKCTVECEVVDNNYGARIFNNKNLKTYLDTGKSKNGVDITNPTKFGCTFFTPTTGVSIGTKREGIFVYDAFRFLIDFMTDGKVGFESTFLDYTLTVTGSTTVRYLCLFGGQMIRTANGRTANISFKDLFVEVNKKYPIMFTIIQGSDGRPTIRIENEEYFYNENTSLTIENIQDLIVSFDNERLYSKVLFGGTTADFDAGLHSFGQVQFLGFKDEEYLLQGECNIDKELDLQADYIFDTNIIQELVETNTTNDTYDEDTFVVEINHLGLDFAVAYPSLSTLTIPYYYNGKQTNNFVAERYSLAGNIALYLGDGAAGFRANKTAIQFLGGHSDPDSGSPPTRPPMQTSTPVKINFPDDTTPPNFDEGLFYDASLSRYISGQAGDYTFSVGTVVRILGCLTGAPTGYGLCNRTFQLHLQLRKFNGTGTLIETHDFPVPTTFDIGGHVTNGALLNIATSHIFFLPVGYYCEAWFYYDSRQGDDANAASTFTKSCGNVRIEVDTDDTYFKTLGTVTGGGVYEEKPIDEYFVTKLEFDRPIADDSYDAIKQDLTKGLIVNHDGVQDKRAWIRKSVRVLSTGETKVELISNLNSSN